MTHKHEIQVEFLTVKSRKQKGAISSLLVLICKYDISVGQAVVCVWMPLPVLHSIKKKDPWAYFPPISHGEICFSQARWRDNPCKRPLTGHSGTQFTTFLLWPKASSFWIPVSAPYLDEEFIQQKPPQDRDWDDRAKEAESGLLEKHSGWLTVLWGSYHATPRERVCVLHSCALTASYWCW